MTFLFLIAIIILLQIACSEYSAHGLLLAAMRYRLFFDAVARVILDSISDTNRFLLLKGTIRNNEFPVFEIDILSAPWRVQNPQS